MVLIFHIGDSLEEVLRQFLFGSDNGYAVDQSGKYTELHSNLNHSTVLSA